MTETDLQARLAIDRLYGPCSRRKRRPSRPILALDLCRKPPLWLGTMGGRKRAEGRRRRKRGLGAGERAREHLCSSSTLGRWTRKRVGLFLWREVEDDTECADPQSLER
jgi:hypothetical protein